MVAFVVSFMIVVVGVAICLWFGHRRPIGTPVTWGEAFVGGTFMFALMTVAYGVVPHQWLEFADTELLWRPDRLLMGISADGIKFGEATANLGGTGRILISYQALRDVVATLIYGLYLGAHMYLWSVWQKRGRSKGALEPTSRFGRPVIRKA